MYKFIELPTHALVCFDKDCSPSVVPIKNVLDTSLKGAKSRVKWSGGKVFSGKILAVGKKCVCMCVCVCWLSRDFYGIGKLKEMQEEEARVFLIEEERDKKKRKGRDGREQGSDMWWKAGKRTKDSKAQVQSEKDREVEKRMDQTCDEKKAKNKNGNHKQADKADKRHKTRKCKWTDVPNSKSQKKT